MERRISKTIDVYNEHALDYMQINSSIRPIQDLLEFFVMNVPGTKILDVGCGPGRDSKYLSDNGFEVVGIDLSLKFHELAKKYTAKCEFLLMDMRELAIAPCSFNGIWVGASFLHIPKRDALSTLQNLHRVLKRNGFMYISCYHGEGEKMVRDIRYDNKKRFFAFYSMSELKSLIKSANFRILREIIRFDEKDNLTWFNLFITPI